MHEKKHEEKEIPEAPVCDPAIGDLTPDYIEWMRKHFADKFEARYKGRISDELLKHKPKDKDK